MKSIVMRHLRLIKGMIEEKGWKPSHIRNGWPSFDEGMLLTDAITSVCAMSEYGKITIELISKVMSPDGRGTSIEIVDWEVRPGRKQADVIDALNRAVFAAEALP